MELGKNSLLTDIIDILALNSRQQDNLENIICDVETKFVERGRSTKYLLNKIEDSIKIGTDLGLIASNDDDNIIRLKFNPHQRAPFSITRFQETRDEYDQDDVLSKDIDSDEDYNEDYNETDEDEDEKENERDDKKSDHDVNEEECNNNNNEDDHDYKNGAESKKISRSKYKSLNPNYCSSKSQTRSVGRPSADLSSHPRKRKSSETNTQRRSRRKC